MVKFSSCCLEDVTYMIFGKEVGEQGTPHLQGYIKFKKQKRFTAIRKLMPCLIRAHLEVAYAAGGNNAIYCSKGNDFVEVGSRPVIKGKEVSKDCRKTRDEKGFEIRKLFREGVSVEEIQDMFIGDMMWSGHTLKRNFRESVKPVIRPGIKVLWLYGEPGTGKSRIAHEVFPDGYIKCAKTKWWNDYMLEDEVIIDDFADHSIDMNHMLRWFDRYKCIVETKGGSVALHATKFIITSNFKPEEIWKKEDGKDSFGRVLYIDHPQIGAINRRLNFLSVSVNGVVSPDLSFSPLYTPRPVEEAVQIIRDWFIEDVSRISDVGGTNCTDLEEEDPSQNGEALEV